MRATLTDPCWGISPRLSAEKREAPREHMALLKEQSDWSKRPAAGVTMDRTKPVQEGVRVKLPAGKTWEALANIAQSRFASRTCFPKDSIRYPIRSIRKAVSYFRTS